MRRASNIAAMLAIAVAVLGLGGVHTAVAGGACALALTAAALQVAYLRRRDHDVLLSIVGLGLIIAAACCVAQLIPLPPFLHQLLNPTGLELWERGRELAQLDEAWRPLSLDPGATADRAVRYVALACMSLWGANLRGTRAWGTFAQWLLPIAVLDLLIGSALFATQSTSFFGLYEPVAGFRGPSTFISTNHGAYFFGLVGLITGAAALGSRRDKPRRASVFAVSVPVFVIAAVSMKSDGVMLALAAAAMTAGFVQWLRLGRPRDLRSDVKIGVGLLAITSTLAVVWLDLHKMGYEFLRRIAFSGEHGGRLELIRAGTAATQDFWRFGAGAGSVSSVLPGYIDWSVVVPASIPLIENDTLEILLSFGWLIGGMLILMAVAQVAAQLRAGTSGQRSPRYAVALVSAVYVALLAQLHFPMFALGLGLPTIVWFELLWSRRRKSTQGKRWLNTGHFALDWRLAGTGLAVLGVVAGLSVHAHFGWYENPTVVNSTEEINRAIWLRPASHVAYVKAATRAARAGDTERALALAEFAVQREPSPRVRLYRAQVLALVDPARGADAFAPLFTASGARGHTLDRFIASVTDTDLRVAILAEYPGLWEPAAAQIQRRNGVDAASSFVVALATKRPNDIEVYRFAATAYLRLNQPALSELWGQLAHEAERTNQPEEIRAPLLLARALRAAGRLEEARATLEAAASNPALVREAHGEALRMRGPPEPALIEFVTRHYEAYCTSPVPAADRLLCWTTEAWLLEARGDLDGAERVFVRVRRRLADPMPLANFFVRKRRCADLITLEHELEPGGPRNGVSALRSVCQP